MLDNFKKGELNIGQVCHDDNCPTIRTWDMGDCTCETVYFTVHQDFDLYTKQYNEAAAMNRKARRAAERSMRRASKTKAARATGAASKVKPTVAPNCSTRQNGGAV